MSTKSTILYIPGQAHLYEEAFDDEHLYLQLEGVEFTAAPTSVTVGIPRIVWEVLRQAGALDLPFAQLTDKDLDARARQFAERFSHPGDPAGLRAQCLERDRKRRTQQQRLLAGYTALRDSLT
jgi:hypothetical protein